MSDYNVKILQKDQLTHNVFRIRLERPAGYVFTAGQATELAIDAPGFTERKVPFTFTGPANENYLELTFKSYPERNGVTKKLAELSPGAGLFITEAWDSYIYKGPGVFIAGGAGITPFLAILRRLKAEGTTAGNRLFFANHTAADIILKDELVELLGDRVVFLLSGETQPGCIHGRIDKAFLSGAIRKFDQPFYICGPDSFVEDIRRALLELGAGEENIITSL